MGLKTKPWKYALDSLERLMHYVDDSRRLLHLAIRGITLQRDLPNIFKALRAELEDVGAPAEDAKDEGGLAETEREEGFPILIGHALIGVWGAFEAAFEDAVVAILLKTPEYFEKPMWSKTKIPLATFRLLNEEEQIRLLITECGVTAAKRGIDRPEALLNTVELSGAVHPEIRKGIWEIQHVRNVIVHRGSIADRQLVEACPWLNLNVGDKVVVTLDRMEEYLSILGCYCTTVVIRIGRQHDKDMSHMYDDNWLDKELFEPQKTGEGRVADR